MHRNNLRHGRNLWLKTPVAAAPPKESAVSISAVSLKDGRTSQIRTLLRLKTAASVDAMMCALINGIQWQLRYLVCTPEELDVYLSACEQVSRGLFYEVIEKPDVLQIG
ncbi:MAG TPA: hypothetical protein VGF37_00525, partial [Chthoniobacterales bacterium]